MKERKFWPWEVDIDTTKIGLERCMRALLVTESKLTSSMRAGTFPFGRAVSAFLLVQIQEGQEVYFKRICQPIRMEPPGRLQVGAKTESDDGHPGRVR